jgi:hypothetical protein
VVAVVGGAVLAAAIVLVAPDVPLLSAVAGLTLVLLPGYAVVGLRLRDPADVLLLSPAIAICCVIASGLVLNVGLVPLERWTWALTLAAVTVVAALLHDHAAVPGPALPTARAWVSRLPELAPRLVQPAVLVAVVVLALTATVRFARAPLPATNIAPYSALWLVPHDDERTSVLVGVGSNELRPMGYRLELRIGPRLIRRWAVRLEPGAQWSRTIALAQASSRRAAVRLTLYRAGSAAVYRRADLFPRRAS